LYEIKLNIIDKPRIHSAKETVIFLLIE